MTRDLQYELPFEAPFAVGENPLLWSPREIWVKLTQRFIPTFGEGRLLDYKSGASVHLADLATYISMFSNSPEGGVIVYGATSKGIATGCSKLSTRQLNDIDQCHVRLCPLAKLEIKKIPVIVDGIEDFCIAIYIPYIGKLVETNKQEAFIRYGDSKHKMSEPEKSDYIAIRQQLSFDLEVANYKFPEEFELKVIQDFCDAFRQMEMRKNWSNEEVLKDRHLIVSKSGKLKPTNALVLLAAKDPRKTIPGCRVRVQRFQTESEGTGNTYSPIRDKFIEGNIVQIIKGAESVLNELIYDVTWLNSEGKFVTTQEYPKWAWFEALVNACVHRSYHFSGTEITIKIFSDRLEIESPGGFVPPVNEDNIYETRAARNHHFMDAMRILGYVRMAREGTRRIRESMKNWGLPDPIFCQETIHGILVRVTLRNDHESRKRATDADVATHFGVDVWRQLQEHEVEIAAYVYRNKRIQVSEASRITGRTWATSKKDLERLTRKGILEFIPGAYVRDPKTHYRLKGEAPTNNNPEARVGEA